MQDIQKAAQASIKMVTPLVGARHGALYVKKQGNLQTFNLLATYAYKERKHVSNSFQVGEGLVGQCALENNAILLTEVPQDYIKINSGLGEATPLNIIVVPVAFEGDVLAVIELASFQVFTPIEQALLDELTSSLGILLESISSRMKMAELLQESQTLTEELQVQSEKSCKPNRKSCGKSMRN